MKPEILVRWLARALLAAMAVNSMHCSGLCRGCSCACCGEDDEPEPQQQSEESGFGCGGGDGGGCSGGLDWGSSRCVSNDDCGASEWCNPGTGRCEWAECLQDYGCPDGYVCSDHRCILEQSCATHEDCPPGTYCNAAIGKCKEPNCSTSTECGPGRHCSYESWECVASCEQLWCPDGLDCDGLSGLCIEPDPEPSCALMPELPEPFSAGIDNHRPSIDPRLLLSDGLEPAFGVLTRFEQVEPDGASYEVEWKGEVRARGQVPFDWQGQTPPETGRYVVVSMDDHAPTPMRSFTIASAGGVALYRLIVGPDEAVVLQGASRYAYALEGNDCSVRRYFGYWQVSADLRLGLDQGGGDVLIPTEETAELGDGVVSYAARNLGSSLSGRNETFDGDLFQGTTSDRALLSMALSEAECHAAVDCPAERPRCNGGLCEAGCDPAGCAGTGVCDQETGICLTEDCSDTEAGTTCQPPLTYCDEELWRCRPGCVQTGCPDGDDWCDLFSGRCWDSSRPMVCYTGGLGPHHAYLTSYMPDGDNLADGGFEAAPDDVTVAEGSEQSGLATLSWVDGYYTAVIRVPLPPGTGFPIAPYLPLEVTYSRATPYSGGLLTSDGDAVVIRDPEGVLLYAMVEHRIETWQAELDELESYLISAGCPERPLEDPTQEVQQIRFLQPELDLLPGSGGQIQLGDATYELFVLEAYRAASPPDPEEDFAQFVLVRVE